MILLNGRRRQARNANAVAPHLHELGFTVHIQKRGVHGLAVLGTQVKDVAHFNAALNGQHALAVGRGIARNHVAQVGHPIGLRQITAPIDTAEVKMFFVCTADPVRHGSYVAVCHNFQRLLQADGPQVTGLAAKVHLDLGHGGKSKVRQALQLAHLDFIHVVVATQQQQPDLGLGHVAFVIFDVGSQHQRFNRSGQGNRQQYSDILAGALARGCYSFNSARGAISIGRRRQSLRFFDICGIVRVRAVNDGVFARGGNHLKLFVQVAADRTTVGSHGAVSQAKAVKNPTVGAGHHLVAGLGGILVAVKAIGVFHNELTPAHQAEAGTALVPEFGLDLVEVLW